MDASAAIAFIRRPGILFKCTAESSISSGAVNSRQGPNERAGKKRNASACCARNAGLTRSISGAGVVVARPTNRFALLRIGDLEFLHPFTKFGH